MITKLNEQMQKALDNKRFEHTVGVAYTATALAMRYESDITSAYIAGMLHDCAKCISDKKKISLCQDYNIIISDAEKKNPSLLHAKAGALLAKEKYDIHDEAILDAIRYHTTGKPDMTTLEKIIYIADYIEPSRKHAPNLTEIRHLAFTDIDKALLKILEDSLDYLNGKSEVIDPTTKETFEFYLNNKKEQ